MNNCWELAVWAGFSWAILLLVSAGFSCVCGQLLLVVLVTLLLQVGWPSVGATGMTGA